MHTRAHTHSSVYSVGLSSATALICMKEESSDANQHKSHDREEKKSQQQSEEAGEEEEEEEWGEEEEEEEEKAFEIWIFTVHFLCHCAILPFD